jgi:uncharacterized protein
MAGALMAGTRAGIGVRAEHYHALLEHGMPLSFTEVITENFLGRGGRALAVLERVRRDASVALHGVSLSIGGVDALNEAYVLGLRELRRRIDAESVSDHLCFGSFGGHYAHDLWPLPCTEEAAAHVAVRVQRVQDLLGERILLENVSSYVAFTSSQLTEWEFISEVCRRADCDLLLDVNNVVVSAYNHGFSPHEFIAGVPLQRVRQIHLAGHTDHGAYRLDDHGGPVAEETWALYRHVIARVGAVPVIVEWDNDVPPIERVVAEARRAQELAHEVLADVELGAA